MTLEEIKRAIEERGYNSISGRVTKSSEYIEDYTYACVIWPKSDIYMNDDNAMTFYAYFEIEACKYALEFIKT